MRALNRAGKVARLTEPEEMVPPLLWLVSPAADGVNGYRFDANTWDPKLAPAAAARASGRPAGFVLRPDEA
jgi:3-oxoacyl-[acyl-carrier protein] reductase